MDQNGLITLSKTAGVFTDADVQNRITNAETPEVSISELIASILAESGNDMIIVVDPVTRKLYAADTDDYSSEVLATQSGSTKAKVLVPESGQSGRSLTWEEDSDSGLDATLSSEIDDIISAARPARTVENLVSASLNAIPDDTSVANMPFVWVDQDSGQVVIVKATDRTTAVAALNTVTPASNGFRATLAEPVESEVVPLVFEGGPTS